MAFEFKISNTGCVKALDLVDLPLMLVQLLMRLANSVDHGEQAHQQMESSVRPSSPVRPAHANDPSAPVFQVLGTPRSDLTRFREHQRQGGALDRNLLDKVSEMLFVHWAVGILCAFKFVVCTFWSADHDLTNARQLYMFRNWRQFLTQVTNTFLLTMVRRCNLSLPAITDAGNVTNSPGMHCAPSAIELMQVLVWCK